MTRMLQLKPIFAAAGAVYSATAAVVNSLVETMPHLATAAAIFSGAAAGCWYARQIWLSFKKGKK
jgi:hypothetical protein